MIRRWLGAVALLHSGAVACSPPNVTMIVSIPADVIDQTAWIEIGAFPNGCPDPGSLAGGLPPSGLADRVAFAAGGDSVGMGNLTSGRYGFAAIARRADCGVLASGCTTVDVSSARAIDISLDDVTTPDASACTNGLVCNGARCLPPASGDDPSAGAGCSMVLVGAGPLPDALDGGPFVTAPAIVPLASGGFLIAYMEYLDVDGTARLTVQPIDTGGGALAPNQQTLDGHCAGQSKIDAAGLAMATTGGLVVLSRPPCTDPEAGSTPSGFELFPLDVSGNVLKRNIFQNASSPAVALSTHALAPSASPGFLVAANVSGAATLLHTPDGAKIVAQTTTAYGTPQDTASRVVRGGITAVEADGPSVGDAGISGSVARVYLVPAGSDPTSVGSPVHQVQASVSALTVVDKRAFLVTNGAGKGEDVAIRGYDLGTSGPVVSGGFSAALTTTVLALDAAGAQNRVFVALEQQDSVGIAIIDGASSTSPQLRRRVDLASDIRIPKSAHDGPVAIAATGTRVAITWAAHKDALTDGEAVGGYAVFACRP
jgi:hypothetical protein